MGAKKRRGNGHAAVTTEQRIAQLAGDVEALQRTLEIHRQVLGYLWLTVQQLRNPGDGEGGE